MHSEKFEWGACSSLCCQGFFMSPLLCFSIFSPIPKLKITSQFSLFWYKKHIWAFFFSLLYSSSIIDSFEVRVNVGLHKHTYSRCDVGEQTLAGHAWPSRVEGGDDCCISTSGSIIIRAGKELLKLMDNVGMGRSEYKHTINRFRLEIRFQTIVHSLNQRTHKKNSGQLWWKGW